MKKTLKSGLVFLLVASFISCSHGSGESLSDNFETPIVSAKPSCFWWWLNSLADEQAVTTSLDELARVGYGEVLPVFSCNFGKDPRLQLPEFGPEFMSDEWMDLFRYTLDEAERNSMTVGVNFCASGWTVGGPWITPSLNGRWFVHSEKKIAGPQQFKGEIPVPGSRSGYEMPIFFGRDHVMNFPEEKMDYTDNVILAFRDKGENCRFNDERHRYLRPKTNRKDGFPHISIDSLYMPLLADMPCKADDDPIAVEDVIDVTDCLKADGTFEWDVPEGDWVIFRLGHVATGAPVVLPLPEMSETPLAIDWLNRKAVDKMFEQMGFKLIEAAGDHVGKTLTSFHTDSYEDGFPNWTDELLEGFKKYRGYDPTPYLPVFAGYIVGSADISDRFLNDYRKTVADMHADNSYGYMNEVLDRYGLYLESEAGGPFWSGTVCSDALKNLGRVDRPMGEFWVNSFNNTNRQNFVGKQTASAAHLYGSRTANAEAFTSNRHWVEYPAMLKYFADKAFCDGINRITFHTTTLQREQDGKPGYEYGAGTHFNPNVTWWNMGAEAWVHYLSKCSSMLQTGQYVADMLVYNGDWAPNNARGDYYEYLNADGYDWDICNEDIILNRLDVDRKGNIVTPDGISYRLLILPEKIDAMPLPLVKKIQKLVAGGANVLGPRPVKDSGLKGYPQCDVEINDIAAEVWGDIDGKDVTAHAYGKGHVYSGLTPVQALSEIGVAPDFTVRSIRHFSAEGTPSEACLEKICKVTTRLEPKKFLSAMDHVDFIHRKTDVEDFYFVTNRSADRKKVELGFRVEECAAQLWNPVTGEKSLLKGCSYKDGHMLAEVVFEPYESFFIVFDHSGSKATAVLPETRFCSGFENLLSLENQTWTAGFDPEWCYDAEGKETSEIVLESLSDLSQHPSEAVKYYSGEITYKTTFNFDKAAAGKAPLFLDLGNVYYMSDVTLNGHALGVDLFAPFRYEITDLLLDGENELTVKVANLWHNRLIGDELHPSVRRTRTNVVKSPSEGLMASGLTGPVCIQAGRN